MVNIKVCEQTYFLIKKTPKIKNTFINSIISGAIGFKYGLIWGWKYGRVFINLVLEEMDEYTELLHKGYGYEDIKFEVYSI